MSTDDDDGSYDKPDLGCIIGASLIDDGVNSAIIERLLGILRPRTHSGPDDRPVGRGQNLRAVQMACTQTPSEVRVSALPKNS